MGAMKHLWQELTDGGYYIEAAEGEEEFESELLNLIGYFGDIDKGADMFKQGVTLKQIEKEYAGMLPDWVYLLLKEGK